nr:PREDICTED: uncharacterized protein LOC104147029 [Struthio camelus australis]
MSCFLSPEQATGDTECRDNANGVKSRFNFFQTTGNYLSQTKAVRDHPAHPAVQLRSTGKEQRFCSPGARRVLTRRDRMFAPLKTLLALFYLIDLISSRPPATTSPKLKLSEITQRIQQFSSGAQIPCNDTRVAQVVFTDRKRSEQELLCQAAKALLRVTKCKKDYEPFIANLQSLHGRTRWLVMPAETIAFISNSLFHKSGRKDQGGLQGLETPDGATLPQPQGRTPEELKLPEREHPAAEQNLKDEGTYLFVQLSLSLTDGRDGLLYQAR